MVRDEKSLRLAGLVWRRSLLSVTSAKAGLTAAQLLEEPPLSLHAHMAPRAAARSMLGVDAWYAPLLGEAGEYVAMVGLESFIQYLVEASHPVLEEPVLHYMSRGVVHVDPEAPVYRVWQLMLSRGLAALPVVEKGGRLVGVVAEHDLLSHGFTRPVLEAEAGPRRGPRVREVMTTPPVVVAENASLGEAVVAMLRRDIGRVYVVDDRGRLRGVVDRSDVVSAWLGE